MLAGDNWSPTPGVPPPPFGIAERSGPATHYVDNSHPSATDENNLFGSQRLPRRSVPALLPAGAVVEVRGGPYKIAATTSWHAQGTAGAPVFIRGVGRPMFVPEQESPATGRIRLAGEYAILEGLVFDRVGWGTTDAGHHIALRHSVVRNYSPRNAGAAVNVNGRQIVIFANEIHANGNAAGAEEVDVHGVKLSAGDEQVWIVGNNIHHNGGDAVQIGSAKSAEPWARFVYVARNRMHEDRENAVDVKQARDIIVSANEMYGYTRTSSSGGEALAAHNNPERVWVINNRVHDAARGIVSTGARGFFVIGNLVHDIREPGFSQTSVTQGHAVMTRATSSAAVVGNTVHNVDHGFGFGAGHPVDIANNIVAGVSKSGHHVGWATTRSADESRLRNNLFEPPISVLVAGRPRGPSGNAKSATPKFVSPPHDYQLQPGSPAVRAGFGEDGRPHPVYVLFEQTYPGFPTIRIDLNGTPRPRSPQEWDLGAYNR